jgi:hypothetical protein
MILPVSDLNHKGKVCDPAMGSIAGATSVWLSSNCYPLCVLVRRLVPVHGIRAANLSGEPTRHRSVSARAALQALSPRDSPNGSAQYVGQRERRSRPAHLCRLRVEPDRYRAAACRRALPGRVERVGLRSGYDHYRSLPVGVFVGTVSLGQGGGQIEHAARSARQHLDLHPHQRRQDARGQHPRSIVGRARCVLHQQTGLSRLRAAVSRPCVQMRFHPYRQLSYMGSDLCRSCQGITIFLIRERSQQYAKQFVRSSVTSEFSVCQRSVEPPRWRSARITMVRVNRRGTSTRSSGRCTSSAMSCGRYYSSPVPSECDCRSHRVSMWLYRQEL